MIRVSFDADKIPSKRFENFTKELLMSTTYQVISNDCMLLKLVPYFVYLNCLFWDL